MAKMGRPTDALKHRFQRILEESNAYERFKQLLIKTKSDETFLRAFAECHDRGFGKALQAMDLDVNDVSDRPTREELDEAIRSLNGHSKGNGVETGK